MVQLSGEEQHQFEAGAVEFVNELRKTAPDILNQSAVVSGQPPQGNSVFLRRYTESLGELATTKFSGSVQALLEEEPEEAGVLLSGTNNGLSVGRFVLQAFRKRLCTPIVEAGLKADIAKIRKEHGLEINATAAGISSGAATAIALSVATIMGGGSLAVVLAPLAGSIALLLLLVGVDTFCSWAASKDD